MVAKVSIQGLQEAQSTNTKQVAAFKPTGAYGAAVRYLTVAAHRYAMYVTHYQTGGLRAAHRMTVTNLRGDIFLDPTGTNQARGGARPSIYGPIEHNRGGSHAFYYRTEHEAGPRIIQDAASMIEREL